MAQYLLDTDVCIELIKHNERVLDKGGLGIGRCMMADVSFLFN